MRIVVPYYEIEENAWCEKEGREYYPHADDLELEYDVEEVEFDREDLEKLVKKYRDAIVEILDKELTLKNVRSRKIDASSNR